METDKLQKLTAQYIYKIEEWEQNLGANEFRAEILGWRARGVQRYAERGNEDKIKNFKKTKKTVGFQP